MHQGRSCFSRVTTARPHTGERKKWSAFLVIIFHNGTPALILRGGLKDVVIQWERPPKEKSRSASRSWSVSVTVQQRRMKWRLTRYPLLRLPSCWHYSACPNIGGLTHFGDQHKQVLYAWSSIKHLRLSSLFCIFTAEELLRWMCCVAFQSK